MDRLLCPNILDLTPETNNSQTIWNHWENRFKNFISSTTAKTEEEKFHLLINYVSPTIYEYVYQCNSYNEAMTVLKNIFVKPANEVFARHKLFTRRQEPNESVDRYIESLRLLSRDCQFKAVSAEINRDDCIRDSFIRGLLNPVIRQRLLENGTLTLSDAHTQARALELAQQHAMQYDAHSPTINAVSHNLQSNTSSSTSETTREEQDPAIGAVRFNVKCYFCGGPRHSRKNCPAKDKTCRGCGKTGHFQHVCRSRAKKNIYAVQDSVSIISCPISHKSKVKTTVSINGLKVSGMLDSGSDLSLIDSNVAQQLNLKINKITKEVGLASNNHKVKIIGNCNVTLEMLGHRYPNTKLSVIPNLCSEIIVGRDLLQLHSTVHFEFGGDKGPLVVSALTASNVEPANLFTNLTLDCRPIAVKSARHSINNSQFIEAEVNKLLSDGIIEKSISPWRAQVLVTSSTTHKKRMVIDYSRTINRFTELDAYPIPSINEIISKVAGYKVFSTIDLKSAYHQIPIPKKDRPYTAFEAAGELYQFTRIPFGTTNGVAAFQRTIDLLIKKEKLKDTFAYLDDITICGRTQAEHDENMKNFMKTASKYNLTINHEKSSFSLRYITLLGHSISDGVIRPDPKRFKPLLEFPPPTDSATLKRALGMFSHYSKFIPCFSKKIKPLTQSSFPLSEEALASFQELKQDIEKASLASIDNDAPFCVETDASETTIAATLSQLNRPVAFFSRTLSDSEKRHSSVEKEAYAIVEAVRHWKHFLLGRHFRLITDQQSVAFMFDLKHGSKVKNEKITRWKLDLSCYSYEILYRPGKENHAADALSRVGYVSSTVTSTDAKLQSIHTLLCHPGVSRLSHWIRTKNLPYSIDDIRRVTSACRTCAEVKPNFFKHQGTLIKASTPFERLNIDFKGPLPSSSRNKYMLTVIDEYSRFPFAFPCRDTSASSVISCLLQLFGIFGTPSFIHSDRGSGFMSQELKTWLSTLGIATSRTTPYNPKGNGQVERYNGTIWRTVQLALKNRCLPVPRWEEVLPNALHSIRSLLCTATNSTPHERMFGFPRRSTNGLSTPSWLLNSGTVLLRKFNRTSKFDPLVEEVTLIEGNPEYAHIRYPDGKETTVSTRHLAPYGQMQEPLEDDIEENKLDMTTSPSSNAQTFQEADPSTNTLEPTDTSIIIPQNAIRRSDRSRKPPAYLKDYIHF
jgi:hypothetical protein